MHSPYVMRSQSSGQGFDTIAFTGKKQTGAVGLKRYSAICVPCGPRQAVEIGREALRLLAWRPRRSAYALQVISPATNSAHQETTPVYLNDTVILANRSVSLCSIRTQTGQCFVYISAFE
jgi:hypothetical protein